MIIVNQERTQIINFEKITEITAAGTKILVGDDIFIPKGEEIAKYETKERAKEVLLEIATHNATFNLFKCSDVEKQKRALEEFLEKGMMFDIYEMPEK